MVSLPNPSESGVFYDTAVQGAAEFADAIRDSSRDQLGYWQQLPLLGLMRWGNAGVYFDKDVALYEKGVVSVDPLNPQHDLHGTYVDCESGEIIYLPDGDFDAIQPANDKQVIKAWLSHVANNGIDARGIVDNFTRQVAQQRPPKESDLETHLETLTPRRLSIARDLGLRTTFRRDELLRGLELDAVTHDAITSIDPFFDSTPEA